MTYARQHDHGGVLVMVAVFLPVILMMASFAIDIGNWWEHKRHLQIEADAAVLAGGGVYAFPCTASVDSAVYSEALKYAGPSATNPGAPYNPQVGGVAAGSVHVVLNGGAAPGSAGAPCGTKWVDATVSETGAPWFIKVANLAGLANPDITAHARAEILKPDVGEGLLPIGFPDPTFTNAAAIWVNESTGAVLAKTQLTRDGTTNGLTRWDNSSSSVSLPVGAGVSVGMIIATAPTSFSINGTLAQICTAPVSCTASSSATGGYSGVRGRPGGGGATTLSSSVMSANNCAYDGQYTDGACSPVVTVTVAGTAPTALRLIGSNTCTGTGCTMTRVGSTSDWAVTIPGPSGLDWFDVYSVPNGCSKVKCMTDLGTAARVLGGTIEPVELAQFSLNGMSYNGPYLIAPATYSAVAQIGVQADITPGTHKIIDLSSSSSQTHALDCDPGIPNLKDEIISGCAPGYAVNGFVSPWYPCPSKVQSFPAQPWQCVPVQTASVSPSQVEDGMAGRTGNTSGCASPSTYPAITDPRRVITIFRVPFDSFQSPGNQTFPVLGFASFYVTGWGGSNGGNQDPCAGDEHPGKGQVAGYFIKYVDKVDNAPATQQCDFTDLSPCELVLTQ
ncbi:MAG TPA: Tad domain-containing protein [Gaiellales bacterium]